MGLRQLEDVPQRPDSTETLIRPAAAAPAPAEAKPPGSNRSAEPVRAESSIGDLPKFYGDVDDAPPFPLPDRAETWGTYGAIWGGFLGCAVGAFVLLLSLLTGSPALLEAVGIFFIAPLVFGVLGGIYWGMRGAVRDYTMEHRDIEAQRQAERREEENREWYAVKQILKRRPPRSGDRS